MSITKVKITSLPWDKPSFWVVAAIGATLALNIAGSIVEKFGSGANLGGSTSSMPISIYTASMSFLALVIFLGGWHALKDKPVASKILFYIAASIILVSGALWTIFGHLSGEAFNSTTGEPLHMYDPSTGKINKEFKPINCRPEGVIHKKYDYTTFDGCYAIKTGAKLIPITHEVAKRLTPSAWPSVVSEWISSDSDGAEFIAPPKPEVITTGCDKTFSSVKKCIRVTLRNGGTFDYRALSKHCPGYDREGALNIRPIEDGFTHRYSSKYSSGETVVHFYSLERGQKLFSKTCPS